MKIYVDCTAEINHHIGKATAMIEVSLIDPFENAFEVVRVYNDAGTLEGHQISKGLHEEIIADAQDQLLRSSLELLNQLEAMVYCAERGLFKPDTDYSFIKSVIEKAKRGEII